MSKKEYFIGIDASKDRLDVAVRPTADIKSFVNDDDGISELLAFLKDLSPVRIIVEATGTLEKPLVRALSIKNLPVVIINPRHAQDFTRATWTLAKTDEIDALILARFGETLRPEVPSLKSEETESLEDLVTRRRQIIEMLTAEKTGFAPRVDRHAKTFKPVSTGSQKASISSMMSWMISSSKIPCGARRTTFSVAFPEWAPFSL
jgi:transposase